MSKFFILTIKTNVYFTLLYTLLSPWSANAKRSLLCWAPLLSALPVGQKPKLCSKQQNVFPFPSQQKIRCKECLRICVKKSKQRSKFLKNLVKSWHAPWNRWDVLSICKEMAATIQRKEQTRDLKLLSKLKCQNSMTDTHFALTKSDSGFWKFDDYDWIVQWKVMNVRWKWPWCFSEFHRSISWDTY